MAKTYQDFLKETNWDFKEARRRFDAQGNSGGLNMTFSEPVRHREITENINNKLRTGLSGVQSSYNPYTGGNETINPNTHVNTGAYNMHNKQQLWEQHGNAGDFDMHAFYRGPDGSLQIKDEYRKNLNNAQNLDDVNAYFNQSMIEKFENRNIKQPTAEGFAKYSEAYGNILSGGQKPPAVYSAVQDMENRRRTYGLDEMEKQMADIHRDMATLEANTRIRKNYASDKAIPMGAIAGRVSTIERQDMERMDNLRREANYLNDQYKTKMGVIEMFMKAGIGDYERSKEAFDDNYRRNRALLDDYRNEVKEENAREREKQKDAQAMIQTLYNGVMDGSVDKSAWDARMEVQVMKMEMQAGYPVGLFKSIYSKNPKADIVQQSVAQVNGRQMLNMVMRDKATGKMYVENVDMGASSTPSEKGRYQYKNDGTVFDTHTGRVMNGGVSEVYAHDVESMIAQCRETGQCGAGVNDYLERLGYDRLMKDSYASKKRHITPGAGPQIGGLAIWQPSGKGALPKYGHVGIVVGIEGDNVLIHDWNWKGDEQQMTHKVPRSAIEKNGGYMTVGGKMNTQGTPLVSEKDANKILRKLEKEAKELVGDIYSQEDYDRSHSELFDFIVDDVRNTGGSIKDTQDLVHTVMQRYVRNP